MTEEDKTLNQITDNDSPSDGGTPSVEDQPEIDGGAGTPEPKRVRAPVPYDRFQEKNEETKSLKEQNAQLLEILKNQTGAPAAAPPVASVVQDTGPDLLSMPDKDAFTKDDEGFPEYDEKAHFAAISQIATENALRTVRHEQQKVSTQTAQQKATQEHLEWVNQGETKHPGFLKKVETQIIPILNQYAKPEFEAVTTFIKKSPESYEVLVYLADNPAETRRLAMMDSATALREVIALESKLKKPESNRTTTAPNPIKPLGGSDTTVASIDDIKDDDEWFKRTRDREIKRKMGVAI